MKTEKTYIEEYVTLAGIDHYLLHYKSKPEDPVLLFIHGGPGQTESFFAFVVEEYAERNYNVVYYDQRGAGKTWLRNKKSKPNTEILKSDLLEIVLHLKKVYGKDKIAILGHSWGSVLGSMFALEHPEHILCYIGCGQVIDIVENERTGYVILEDVVKRSGNAKDIKKLQKIGEYPPDYFDMNVYRKMGQIRSLQGKYGLAQDFNKTVIDLWRRSPVMGIKDLLPFMTGMMVNIQVMKELMAFDLKKKENRYRVPVYYVLGEKDCQTPVEISIKYFENLEAPDKKLYLIPNAGHAPMIDNVEEYRKAVEEIVGLISDVSKREVK
ncbi:MAG: alpha/beta hydrolase [Lachnospiraceae bacterium]|nr:alpha/beta hydrolase [Lachnospiraceae bacterium]